MNRLSVTALFTAAVAAAFTAAAADSWTWRMPVKYYQNLDFEHRAAIDKARDAYIRAEESTRRNESFPDKQLPLYRAAAAEWEKYRVQFEFDNDFNVDAVNAYVEFMTAYSLQGARDRNKAIKAYQSLLDLYPGETWITAAAQYMIGANQLANGENNRAKGTFTDMVDNPEMVKHPLASRAYCKIGEFYWSIGKTSEAQENWQKGFSDIYREIAKSDYDNQRTLYRASLGVTHKWAELTDFIFEGVDEKNIKERLRLVIDTEDYFRSWGTRNWLNDWYYARKFDGKEKELRADQTKWNKGFTKWHEDFKSLFQQCGQEWSFVNRTFDYRRDCLGMEEAKKYIPEMTKVLKASSDEDKPKRARDLAIRLADARMFVEARTLLEFMKVPLDRLWLTYEIDRREGQWDAVKLTLEQIIANPDPQVSLNGKKTLAWVYKDATREYEKAIKLYEDINQPPGTLWDIQWCYRRLGEKIKAQATLDELAFFPDQAARAVWTKAEYFREDGEKDKAIALYRRLLSQPEWKKTGESSQAHQRLEAWGIATGGAVINEVR